MSQRTRENAGSNETKDIASIINHIHNKTAVGLRFMNQFKTTLGNELLNARVRKGSNRGTHYDFEVLVRYNDGREEWKRVEHKGSATKREFAAGEKPWEAGVQWFNGGCEKFPLCKKYAKVWYDMYIASGELKKAFALNATQPTFEEWFASDCKAQDNPKTVFGKELKANVRKVRGDKASLLEKREAVNAALEITEEDKKELISVIQGLATNIMNEKEIWLTVLGPLDGDFTFQWYGSISFPPITSVEVSKEKDIKFKFQCGDEITFDGILRWGRGAGFSNLRLDAK
jgi:hypothetical protein